VKVLIADDDRVLTRLLAAGLQARGWQVEVAHDGMQALMLAMRGAPDVIVLDIGMPAGTGYGVLTKLRQSVRTDRIPVVVVSGSIEPEEEANVLAQGAVAFLRKPADAAAVHAALLHALEPAAVAG